MRPRLVTVLFSAAALCLGLPACGSAEEPSQHRGSQQPAKAAAAKGKLALKQVGNFQEPVYVAAAPGFPRLLFVVEQEGRVMALEGGRRRGTFLDLSGEISSGGERGLLSIAFPPDYASSRGFYV